MSDMKVAALFLGGCAVFVTFLISYFAGVAVGRRQQRKRERQTPPPGHLPTDHGGDWQRVTG